MTAALCLRSTEFQNCCSACCGLLNNLQSCCGLTSHHIVLLLFPCCHNCVRCSQHMQTCMPAGVLMAKQKVSRHPRPEHSRGPVHLPCQHQNGCKLNFGPYLP